jgi:hypothetical protein
VFLAAVELAAPILAATMLVEVAISLLGKLSPQLPVMSLTVPMKTLTGFALLTGSLALWPRFIEARFSSLLDLAERLIDPSSAGPSQPVAQAHGLGFITASGLGPGFAPALALVRLHRALHGMGG